MRLASTARDAASNMADSRIRTVTQVLENIVFRGEVEADCVVLSDFCPVAGDTVAGRV